MSDVPLRLASSKTEETFKVLSLQYNHVLTSNDSIV